VPLGRVRPRLQKAACSYLLAGLVLLGCGGFANAAPASAGDQLARGEYLARAGNCTSCHSRENGRELAGGVAFDTAFGTLYSSNITPDEATGIGQWSDDEFVRAMREGVGRNGEHLYPAFPYTAYTQLSRDDILAIKAYLMSRPAVKYRPPANDMTFPFNYRSLLWFWKQINFDEARFEPDPAHSDAANRGAYLADALGHCGACHTPRNWSQGLDTGSKYAGAVQQGWAAFNITPSEDGIGEWSDDELAQYLHNGHVPNKYVAGGPMAEVVTDSLRYLSEADIQAMVAYLRTLEPRAGDVPTVQAARQARAYIERDEQAATAGETLFENACASCHLPDGRGVGGASSAFIEHSPVRDPRGMNLIRVILNGIDRTGADGRAFMPAYRDLLSNEQIATLANYIGRRHGGYDAQFTAADIAAARED
jgi:mono/diheme cytochrome c family protein